MPSAPVLLEHPSSLEHDTGSHPERADRIVAVSEELARRGDLGWERRSSQAASREQLCAVHSPGYVAWIEETALRGGGQLDPDTLLSPGSFLAAAHGAGGAVGVVDAVLGGAPAAFSLHRPPGHHALPERAMGFCLFNHVAVAARHALDAHGLRRVLILDWDVHHGNGTNDIFSGSAEVLFISIHQSPNWPPGTGAASDLGTGPGRGYTVNLPVPPGSGDVAFCALVEGVAAPLIRSFGPELVLISAGFDAHRDDPLAACAVTEAGFAAMARAVRSACAEVGAGLGAVLEGGYHLGALAGSVAATLAALAPGPQGAGEPGGAAPDPGPADGGRPGGGPGESSLVSAARQRLRPFWPDLG